MYKRARRGPRQRRRVNIGNSIPPERKYLDCHNGAGTLAVAGTSNARNDWTTCESQPSSGCVGCLSAPAIGDAATNRDGKHIIIKSFQIHGSVSWGSGATAGNNANSTCNVHLALVLNKSTLGATIDSENFYTSANDTLVLRAVPFRNINRGKQFRLLKSWNMHSGSRNMAYQGLAQLVIQSGTNHTFSAYLKMHLPVNFNAGTSADVANVTDNSIHLIWNSDPNLASDAPTVTYQTRMRFIG